MILKMFLQHWDCADRESGYAYLAFRIAGTHNKIGKRKIRLGFSGGYGRSESMLDTKIVLVRRHLELFGSGA